MRSRRGNRGRGPRALTRSQAATAPPTRADWGAARRAIAPAALRRLRAHLLGFERSASMDCTRSQLLEGMPTVKDTSAVGAERPLTRNSSFWNVELRCRRARGCGRRRGRVNDCAGRPRPTIGRARGALSAWSPVASARQGSSAGSGNTAGAHRAVRRGPRGGRRRSAAHGRAGSAPPARDPQVALARLYPAHTARQKWKRVHRCGLQCNAMARADGAARVHAPLSARATTVAPVLALGVPYPGPQRPIAAAPASQTHRVCAAARPAPAAMMMDFILGELRAYVWT